MTQPDKTRPAQRVIDTLMAALDTPLDGRVYVIPLELTGEDVVAVMEALAVGDGFLWQVLDADTHAAIAQDRAPSMPDSKTPDTHNPEVGQGSAVLAAPTSDAHLGAVEP